MDRRERSLGLRGKLRGPCLVAQRFGRRFAKVLFWSWLLTWVGLSEDVAVNIPDRSERLPLTATLAAFLRAFSTLVMSRALSLATSRPKPPTF